MLSLVGLFLKIFRTTGLEVGSVASDFALTVPLVSKLSWCIYMAPFNELRVGRSFKTSSISSWLWQVKSIVVLLAIKSLTSLAEEMTMLVLKTVRSLMRVLILPPTPSQQDLPWQASVKIHSIERLYLTANCFVRKTFLLFLYWYVGESITKTMCLIQVFQW